jgi:hypothetical protein
MNTKDAEPTNWEKKANKTGRGQDRQQTAEG